MNLNNKQKQHLKGLAHLLKPVVMLGNNGLTEGVMAEIEQAIEHHELIKIKIAAEERDTKKLIADAIVRGDAAAAEAAMQSMMQEALDLINKADSDEAAEPRQKARGRN